MVTATEKEKFLELPIGARKRAAVDAYKNMGSADQKLIDAASDRIIEFQTERLSHHAHILGKGSVLEILAAIGRLL